MKAHSKLLIAMILCCAAQYIVAQNNREIPTRDIMYANRKTYELVKHYAEYSDFTQDFQTHSTWLGYLFSQNPTLMVAKDLMPWYGETQESTDMVTLREYLNFYAVVRSELAYYEVKNVYVKKMTVDKDQINYLVSVTKVQTLKKNNVTDSCKVILHITYNNANREALITSISWDEKGDYFQPYLMAKYLIPNANLQSCVPQKLTTRKGKTLTSTPVNISQTDHVDKNSVHTIAPLILTEETLNGNTRIYSFKNKKSSLGLSADFQYGFSDKQDAIWTDDRLDSMNAKAMCWHIGLNFYQQFLLSGRNRVGLDLGLNVGKYYLNFNCSYADTLLNQRDAELDNCDRFVTLNEYREKAGNLSFSIPVILRYDYFVKDNLSIVAGVGVNANLYLPLKTRASYTGTYAGYYDDLFDICIAQDPALGYGTFESDFKEKDQNAVKTFSATLIGMFGVQCYLSKDVSLDFNITYNYLLHKAVRGCEDFHLSTDKDNFQSLTYLMTNLPKHNLGFNFRIKYNF